MINGSIAINITFYGYFWNEYSASINVGVITV